jgi:hypothetical protein
MKLMYFICMYIYHIFWCHFSINLNYLEMFNTNNQSLFWPFIYMINAILFTFMSWCNHLWNKLFLSTSFTYTTFSSMITLCHKPEKKWFLNRTTCTELINKCLQTNAFLTRLLWATGKHYLLILYYWKQLIKTHL